MTAHAGPPQHLRTTSSGDFRITYWTSEQGLPQNTVNCLLQTRDGYLWAGTRYGLARFDGVRLTAFVEPLSFLDASALDVRSLAEDHRGDLWLSAQRMLICYRDGRFSAATLPEDPFPGRIQGIAACRDGGLWVAKVGGLFRFLDGKIDRVFRASQFIEGFCDGRPEIEQICADSMGRIWVMTICGSRTLARWQRLNPQSGAAVTLMDLVGLSHQDIGAVMEDRAGRLWVGRPGELLCWKDGMLSRFAADAVWGKAGVESLAEDSRGNVWIVSRGPSQLHRFDGSAFTSLGQAEGIRNPDDIRCVLPDREGNVWVGSGAGGLFRVQPRPLVSLLTGSFSAMDEIYSVAPGADGQVWMATTYGLVRYHEGQFLVHTNFKGLAEPGALSRIRPVYQDRSGQVWCGLDRHGLQVLRDGLIAPAHDADSADLGRAKVQSLLEDRAGTLWIATRQGLWERRDGRYRQWTTNEGLGDNDVSGLVAGPEGSLWIGSARGGLHQLRDGRIRRFTTREGLLHDNAWPLRAESDGTLWVGTPLGMNRLRNGEVRSITMRDGLFDNLAYALLEDRRSNYWTFGNRGIWRMKKAALNAVADGQAKRVLCVSYGEADGMASSEGNGDEQPCAVARPNGELWFPTTRGVVIVDPEKLRDNEVRPGVVIEEVRVDDEVVFRDGGSVAPAVGMASSNSAATAIKSSADAPPSPRETRLRLTPGRARVLEIRYTANTFIDPEKARFRYRLEGYDADWHEADTRRLALYTNLRPGDYRFRVEACNHHGYWSATPAEFAFSLAPHFYQTWLFFLLCGCAVVGTGLGWHLRRLRARRRLHEFRQLQARHDERSRIAKDLHDDLGANLTGLALQVDVARRNFEQPAATRGNLEGIAQSIRAMADRLREVVWTVNPSCDTLESFSGYVCQYAEAFLAAAELRCRLDIPADLPACALSPEMRHHLLMITKEALNNAAKHARATEVRVGLHATGAELVLTLADNGRGGVAVPSSDVPQQERRSGARSGRGLENILRRVHALKGAFHLESPAGMGTRLTVRVPMREFRLPTDSHS